MTLLSGESGQKISKMTHITYYTGVCIKRLHIFYLRLRKGFGILYMWHEISFIAVDFIN